VIVRLTVEQRAQVEAIAASRLGLVDLGELRDRFNAQAPERNAMLGAAGEVVVAAAFGWPAPRPLISAGDLGRYDVGTVQVRARWRPSYDLMIAPEDRYHAGDPFVLVVRLGPDAYRVVGWIVGTDAMIDRYWTGNPGHRLHGRIPHDCWSVPQADLNPVLRELEAVTA
jgi:hypothetical protein